MHYPCVIVLGGGPRLANLLRVHATDRHWVLREVNSAAECKNLIAPGSAAIILTRIDETKKAPWELLEWLQEHRPGVAVVAVLGGGPTAVAELACDLGVCAAIPAHCLDSEVVPVIQSLVFNLWETNDGVPSSS